MSVIVHSNENIDSALKRLHREVLREKILETYREKQYRSKEADDKISGSLEDAEKMLGQISALLERKENEDEGNAVRWRAAAEDVYAACQPHWCRVTVVQKPRGGIRITATALRGQIPEAIEREGCSWIAKISR